MPSSEKYRECLEHMFNLRRFGIKLGLSTITAILEGLDNPQDAYSCIHIAGTNGKGSIASTIASILLAAGHSVGLYTSPHLVRFNERISVNGSPITDEEVFTAYQAVKSLQMPEREPTFFEFTTAMALHEFKRKKVDWAVIETGMGGRLDATNVLHPSLCIISNISIEHKSYLGSTIKEIAGEKGGIIKKNTPVITGVYQQQAICVIEAIAKERSAPLFRLGKDFKTRRLAGGGFFYSGIEKIFKAIEPALAGDHQVENTAMAIAACEVLNSNGTAQISDTDMIKGIANVTWPGRLEVVSRQPRVILDGAHNLGAARQLAKHLAKTEKGRKVTMVVGILDDKPYRSILKILLPFCTRLFLTRARIARALPPEILRETASKLVEDITIIEDVGSAFQKAVSASGPEETVCVAGSLYVVGETKEWLEANPLKEP